MRRIIGPCASGALRPELRLGDFVVCDQFVDRTAGRADTFYEGPRRLTSRPPTPTAPISDASSSRRPDELGIPRARRRDGRRDPGSVASPPGRSPGGSSRPGWDAINMTAYPECHLARELELCYATIAMVTDYDVRRRGVATPVTAGARQGGVSPRTTSGFASSCSRRSRGSARSRTTSARTLCGSTPVVAASP